jgi:glycogen operon protein
VASINFVTAHDGFTLLDLVSYNEKHNEANGEDNNDGESHNRSWNSGVEGPTDDPEILALRSRQQRNFLATLMLSQGVPMISHGDELGRTQGGNNNGFCQDNEITWVDWSTVDSELMAFAHELAELRAAHPVFRRRRFFHGLPVRRRGSKGQPDIAWFTPDGHEMTEEDWDSGFGRSVAVYLNGQGITERDSRGERVVDDSFVLCFNAHDEAIDFTVPGDGYSASWQTVVDTDSALMPEGKPVEAGSIVTIAARSLIVLQSTD